MWLQRQYRIFFLIALAFALGVSSLLISKLEFSSNFDEFLAADDSEFEFYKEAQSQFESGNPQMIIGIEADSNIFNQKFLKLLLAFEAQLKNLDGVKYANSIASLNNQVKGILRIEEKPFVHVSQPEKYRADTTLLFQYRDVYPKFVSADRKSICVFITLEEELPIGFADSIQRLTKSAGFQKTYFYGLSIAENSYQQTLKKEVGTLSLIALLSVIFILWLSFRSYSLVGISFLFLVVVNTITLGVAQLIGASLNVLTVTIPAIVAIVSMSDIIHVYNRLQEEKSDSEFQERIRNTYRDLKNSLMLTSITTAIGFLSLIFTNIIPFTHFGIATAAGIFIAYILTVFLLPILFQLAGNSNRKNNWSLPAGVFQKVQLHAGKVILGTLIIATIFVYCATQVKINTFLYDDLDADDPLSQSLAFFEENFFGIRDVELFVSVADGRSVYDREVIDELEKLDHYLNTEYEARDVYSLVTLLKRYNRAFYSGKPSKFTVPKNPVQLERLMDFVRNKAAGNPASWLINQQQSIMRVYVKTTDDGSAIAKVKNKALRSFIGSNLDSDVLQVQVSGQPLFIDRSNEQITKYLFKSLLGALAIIFLIVLVVYRSFRLAVIAFIPNLLPMLAMFGLMYWFDITLKKSTAVVFTIAFGIAVDDTIHFVSRFQQLLKNGDSTLVALQHAWQSTGKAILITSLVLIGGFGSFAFSAFQSTFLTGTLVSAALLMAVLSDLIVLPVLLNRFYKKK